MRFAIIALTIALLLSPTVRGEAPTTQPAQDQINSFKKLAFQFADEVSAARAENEMLRQEIDRLKAANNKLKAELFASNSRINSMIKPAPFSLTPQPPTNTEPEHSNSFPFNGRNVYIIPLEARNDHIEPSTLTIPDVVKKPNQNLIDNRQK